LDALGVYAEFGAIGIIVFLFVFLVMKVIKKLDTDSDSQAKTAREMEGIRGAIANIEGIVIKLIDRWNRSDETQRERSDQSDEAQRERLDRSDELSREFAQTLAENIGYIKGVLDGLKKK
jgi:hypothetical protein